MRTEHESVPAVRPSEWAGIFRVRTDECDLFGHVNNAVYLHYLLRATLDTRLWEGDDSADWIPGRLRIDYRAPLHADDEFLVSTRTLARDDQRLHCEYEISRAVDRLSVASAMIEWRRYTASQSHLSPPKWSVDQEPAASRHENAAKPYAWQHSVAISEVDATGRVSLSTWFRWLETAVFDASARAGWPLERMHSEDFLSVVVRHEAEVFHFAARGDRIAVVSRLVEVRPVRGTWLHEVYRLAPLTLLMRDYATGAFLDWHGHIRRGPRDMLDALVRGEGAFQGGGEP